MPDNVRTSESLLAFKQGCEQQTHFRSSLLSLRKIVSANLSGKTISVIKTFLANHGLALKIKELTRVTSRKIMRGGYV